MNNFDDLFVPKKEQEERKTYKAYDKEEWAEKKKAERASAFELLDTATKEIMENGEKFKDFLNVGSRFDRYSVSNLALIAKQMPTAVRLADFDTWKDSDVFINKGEKGITILEPGNEFTREDGTTGFSVNVKKVFDISQTSEAENYTEPKMPKQRIAMKALIASSPCDIRMTDNLPEVMAMFMEEDKAIYIRQGLEGNDVFRCLANEIAVAKLQANGIERKDAGFTAYCVSYILCEKYGFDTSDFNFDGVAKQFEGVEPKEARLQLDKVRDIVSDISYDMNRNIKEEQIKEQKSRNDAR